MVNVRMAVDDRSHWQLSQLLVDERLRCLGTFHRHQQVKHDPAAVPAHEGDVGHVVAAHLIDAIGDFKQAIDMVHLRVTPEAWIGGVRRLGVLQEAVGILAPDDLALCVRDFQRFRCRDQPLLRKCHFLIVVKIQQIINVGVGFGGDVRRALGVRRQLSGARRAAAGGGQQRRTKQNA